MAKPGEDRRSFVADRSGEMGERLVQKGLASWQARIAHEFIIYIALNYLTGQPSRVAAHPPRLRDGDEKPFAHSVVTD
jgi:hypothetical protein